MKYLLIEESLDILKFEMNLNKEINTQYFVFYFPLLLMKFYSVKLTTKLKRKINDS